VEAATGSLGHGLPLALGIAAAQRIQGYNSRCFVLMSDGECEEGTTWEAALIAAANKLDRICVMIDYNKWQATGRSDEVAALAPLREKWQAFGWDAHEIDGHDMAAIVDLVKTVPNGSGKPIAIIANTIKGKGVSFMQDDNNWHYRIPTAEEVVSAKRELLEKWGLK
jgi:transketolase